MDAFAASRCKDLAINKNFAKKASIIALFFGIFQGLMPFLGYILGSIFTSRLQKIDRWIAFVLLGIIGIQMILESRDKSCKVEDDKIEVKNLLMLSIETSIDAFAFLKININVAIFIIAITTFIVFCRGVYRKDFWNCIKSQGSNSRWFDFNIFRYKNTCWHLGLL